MKIQAVIADDEPLARAGIRALLEDDPDIELIGECGTGRGLVALVIDQTPDLIFLDVEMPEMDGFDTLESLPSDAIPSVIFVTAYDQYAVNAFEVHALDYVLKPIDRERFRKALQRAKDHIKQQRDHSLTRRILDCLEDLKAPTDFLDRVVIKNGGDVIFLKVEEIDWIEAEGNYVRLHAGKDSHLLRETLSNLESQLNPAKFIRIHRSTIVNSDRIRKLEALFHGDCNVILNDGTQLMLSRNYRKNIKGV